MSPVVASHVGGDPILDRFMGKYVIMWIYGKQLTCYIRNVDDEWIEAHNELPVWIQKSQVAVIFEIPEHDVTFRWRP